MVLCLFVRDQGLGFKVVLEGESFEVLLAGGGCLALVAPGVWTMEIGRDGGEKVFDCEVARFNFFGYGRGKGGVKVTRAVAAISGVFYRKRRRCI